MFGTLAEGCKMGRGELRFHIEGFLTIRTGEGLVDLVEAPIRHQFELESTLLSFVGHSQFAIAFRTIEYFDADGHFLAPFVLKSKFIS